MIDSSEPNLVLLRAMRRFRLRLTTGAPTGAGAFRPGVVLLVAEQTSHQDRNERHAPFCSVRGCSGWLNAKLEAARIPEDEMFWINAIDNDGSEIDLRKIFDRLNPRAVIALGRVADRQLIKFGIPHHHYVPHPQAWKRFRFGEPYPLIDLLRRLTIESGGEVPPPTPITRRPHQLANRDPVPAGKRKASHQSGKDPV